MASRNEAISVSLQTTLVDRLRAISYKTNVSRSAIVEHALVFFLANQTDDEIGRALVSAGASKRSPT